ncbi:MULTISPECIES: amino acid ABC transporter permease [Helicobacter]|uniref:Amino acid ABC transporter permease n=1 Tax=Helicobacter typhlonius TaxID=76936 RepID=A0A099UCK0_9HELI|nr:MULTISPECIES: amino acid ABC transporter permease [Helicobacter]TLD78422.1 amino acid ABC transporter permease [Helicobacter typhlonius]TLD88728.1 amino acid ABC transporter permease [Helicobacter sp. MIT 03-1616]CUU39655.1 Glutamine ABC transporter, permease protein GlnP [Helicobacter typhlonius]
MLDIAFMRDCVPLFAKALSLTLYISFFGIALSLIIGFISAWILFFKVRFLRVIVGAYVELARNTPLLIQLFFLYYGLHSVVGANLNEYVCAIAGLAFLGGGYMCESFRSGLESIAHSQIESAQSLGLKSHQMMFYVILPQSLSVALPSVCANVIFLLKETSVVSVIALADIMFVAKDIITQYYKTNEALVMLILSYLVVLLPLSVMFSLLERYYKRRVI